MGFFKGSASNPAGGTFIIFSAGVNRLALDRETRSGTQAHLRGYEPDLHVASGPDGCFAKQLVNELYHRAHKGDFAALVLIVDPQTLGQLRPILHRAVQNRVLSEHGKTLTKASITDIQKALS